MVLVVYSGRPVLLGDMFDRSDAVVAAWLPGTEATELPELLFGRAEFEGTLPQPWPLAVDDLEDTAVSSVPYRVAGLAHADEGAAR